MTSIEPHGWDLLQGLIQAECDVLWVTCRSQMDVDRPNGSLVHGLFRSITNENPALNLITLDVEKPTGDAALHAIATRSRMLGRDLTSRWKDSEFVERDGTLYIRGYCLTLRST
jgi:hypothetical protein